MIKIVAPSSQLSANDRRNFEAAEEEAEALIAEGYEPVGLTMANSGFGLIPIILMAQPRREGRSGD
jgi:hypothetical protein